MPFSNLVYISKATVPMDQEALEQIGRVAQDSNQRRRITGVLMYGSGHFVQFLEGPDEQVDNLIKRITADGRHTDLQIVLHRHATKRLLPDWSMGTLNFESEIHGDIDAQVEDIMKVLDMCDQADSPMAVGTVLKVFREKLRRAQSPARSNAA